MARVEKNSARGGYYGRESVYDSRQNEIERTYIGVDGRPILLDAGYAITRYVYDAQSKLVRVTFHGVEGRPVLRKEGYHGWKTGMTTSANKMKQFISTYKGGAVTPKEPTKTEKTE